MRWCTVSRHGCDIANAAAEDRDGEPSRLLLSQKTLRCRRDSIAVDLSIDHVFLPC